MIKLFILKKYIFASSLKEALKKEKEVDVDDAWIDDDWRKNMMEKEKPLGFNNSK